MTAAALSRLETLSPTASLTAELEELAARLRLVTVRIGTRGARFEGVGAGILWPVAGRRYVITNAHVAPPQRGDSLVVENTVGTAARARVIAREPELDLALLEPVELRHDWPAPAIIGDARALRTGEIVVALGHPFGVGGALSVGVVHAVPNGDDAWVRADIRLAPGNSGGPLATLDGVVVGVNCMIARGLGIAIPAHVADRFAREATAR
jgi:serine protease Do